MEERDDGSKMRELSQGLQAQLEQVRTLLEEESPRDPESAPYRSRYHARELLESMKKELAQRMDQWPSSPRLRCMLAVVLYQLGVIGLETEELSTGEEMLGRCLHTLGGDGADEDLDLAKPMAVLPAIAALNQLGVLWAQRNDPKLAKEHLERAEKLYHSYITDVGEPPYDMPDLFDPDLNAEEASALNSAKLEKAFTHTLYYLAQVYGSLGDNQNSVSYCHRTLKRQLESREFDAVEWALNAATLSQCFLSRDSFRAARHHLSAASCILENYGKELGVDGQAQNDDQEVVNQEVVEEREAKREAFCHRRADVARCWAKYGLLLLSFSKDRLLKMAEEDNENTENAPHRGSERNNEGEVEGEELCFPSLELSCYEDQITYKPLRDYEEARLVFLEVQRWIKQAQEYYSMEDHASDHVQIVQDLSQAYKFLAFFENSEERQCRMHKRRVDLLEPLVKELNPQYYLLICRQLYFELGEILSDMMDLKVQRLRDDPTNRPTPQALQKVNRLAQESLTQFEAFLDSLKDQSSKKLPDPLPEEVVRPALVAYFHVARLHGKIITPERQSQLEHMSHSLEAYNAIVTYCNQHPEAARLMSPELEVCTEMANLLPVKMERLTEETH